MATVTQGWFVDPLGRFDGRLFDGEAWTDQVSRDGRLLIDIDWIAANPALIQNDAVPQGESDAHDQGEPVDQPCRRGSDRRQVNIEVEVDRRRGDRRIQIQIPSADI